MLLTIDIGNTNIVIGAFEKDCLKFVSRIQTNKYRMADEYAIIIKGILEFNGYTTDMFDGAIASCVVPPLIPTMKKTIDRLFNTKLMIISPGIKTGLNIKIDNPATLGSDLACGAVGAIKKYSLPCIVIDLGTATKFYVISDDNSFLGGAIMPGVSISLDALSKNTAQLPHIELQNTKNVVGTNSIDCMCSGVVYGTASMIDGMIERMEQELGKECTVVVTGGLSKNIIPHCKKKLIADEELVLIGLKEIYNKNC